MVEATREVREAAIAYWGNDNPPQELLAGMKAAFNAGRASVLAELESNECICPKCGIRHGGRVGDGGF